MLRPWLGSADWEMSRRDAILAYRPLLAEVQYPRPYFDRWVDFVRRRFVSQTTSTATLDSDALWEQARV
jgi:hypothetical protein